MTSIATIRIVLVEPAGALNVGSVARIMKNMGLSRLVLVNPQCDAVGAEARMMAVHAAEVLEQAQQVATLPDALVGCRRAIATTGRDHIPLERVLESPRSALLWLLETSEDDSALIFGREDSGLTNEELNYAQRFIRIPSTDAYPSLNLAQAVAICCYELHEFACSPQLGSASSPPILPSTDLSLASLDQVNAYLQDLEVLLLKIGYLYPHTATSRMEKFRHLLSRAYPSDAEIAMLRGIISQLRWALGDRPPSQ